MTLSKQEEREKRFDEKLPQMISDLIWAVTDGGQKIEPKRFLSYQEEPVYEFETIKRLLQSEINLALAERDREVAEILSKLKNKNCPGGKPTGFCCDYHCTLSDITYLITNK